MICKLKNTLWLLIASWMFRHGYFSVVPWDICQHVPQTTVQKQTWHDVSKLRHESGVLQALILEVDDSRAHELRLSNNLQMDWFEVKSKQETIDFPIKYSVFLYCIPWRQSIELWEIGRKLISSTCLTTFWNLPNWHLLFVARIWKYRLS